MWFLHLERHKKSVIVPNVWKYLTFRDGLEGDRRYVVVDMVGLSRPPISQQQERKAMNILVACKIVPDDQDITVASDGSLDSARAHEIVSQYDLNAIEAAAQLKEANDGSTLKAISVGPKKADDSKTKKNILSRGVDELFLTADDSLADLDSRATASELSKLVAKAGDWDLIVVGDGSADDYAKQTGVQLACALDVPYIAGATDISANGDKLEITRNLESEAEQIEVSLPAVVSVSPEIAEPRIAGMRDILKAGKKPQNVESAEDKPEEAVETVSIKAPKQADRKQEVFDASDSDGLDKFVAAVKAEL